MNTRGEEKRSILFRLLSWLSLYLFIGLVIGGVLFLVDPRYYVMPNGRLPEGLPVLGTTLRERLLASGVLGALGSMPLTGLALLARVFFRRSGAAC